MTPEDLYQWMMDNPTGVVNALTDYQGASLEGIQSRPDLFKAGGARGSFVPADKIKHGGQWIDTPYNAFFPTGEFLGNKVSETTQDIAGLLGEIGFFTPGALGLGARATTKAVGKKLTDSAKKKLVNTPINELEPDELSQLVDEVIVGRDTKIPKTDVTGLESKILSNPDETWTRAGESGWWLNWLTNNATNRLREYKKGEEAFDRLKKTYPEFSKRFGDDIEKYNEWVDKEITNALRDTHFYRGGGETAGSSMLPTRIGSGRSSGVKIGALDEIGVAPQWNPLKTQQTLNHEIEHHLHRKIFSTKAGAKDYNRLGGGDGGDYWGGLISDYRLPSNIGALDDVIPDAATSDPEGLLTYFNYLQRIPEVLARSTASKTLPKWITNLGDGPNSTAGGRFLRRILDPQRFRTEVTHFPGFQNKFSQKNLWGDNFGTDDFLDSDIYKNLWGAAPAGGLLGNLPTIDKKSK
jgi:hypothetical protein